MPKNMKEKRHDKEFKASPIGYIPARNGDEKVQAKEKQKCIPGDEINRIWMDAIQKDSGTEPTHCSSDQSVPGNKRPELGSRSYTCPSYTSERHPTLPPLTLTDSTHQWHGQLESQETYNFGQNPNYHDEGFRYSPGTSVSTPPSPFSSRFYDSNIKKVKSHKRSWSTPDTYQIFHASMGLEHQSGVVSTTHFPLPTLRPITPPDIVSPPSSPLLARQDHDGEPGESVTVYRYSRQHPQAPHNQNHLHQRDHTVVIPGHLNTALDGVQEELAPTQEASVEPVDSQRHAEFQPVMIYEQGQSVTGQKWRRKVTVFRSEILERLEKEGLIICRT